MLLGILCFIASVAGIVGFFVDMPALIIVGAVIYIIETSIEYIAGRLKSLSTTIVSLAISAAISLACDYNLLLGLCMGLCIESVLLSIIGYVSMAITFFILKPDTQKYTNDERISVHILSPIDGEVIESWTVNDDNRENILRWYNKEDNCVYCMEIFKKGEHGFYFVSKDIYNEAKLRFSQIGD